MPLPIQFLPRIEATLTKAHRFRRKGTSNNRDPENRDFTLCDTVNMTTRKKERYVGDNIEIDHEIKFKTLRS